MEVSKPIVRYMDRSREYYGAQGYEKPYRWAHHDAVPFAPLNKPLAEATLAIVTTAMPDPTYTRTTRRLAIEETASAPASLYTREVFWDKESTHTDDRGSYFPLDALVEKVREGRLLRIAPHYYCLPTTYSQRSTIERDAPPIVAQCLRDEVDAVALVPL
jgi:D-proline reductase (dithiol) PrdB